jgi:hypothetical protein
VGSEQVCGVVVSSKSTYYHSIPYAEAKTTTSHNPALPHLLYGNHHPLLSGRDRSPDESRLGSEIPAGGFPSQGVRSLLLILLKNNVRLKDVTVGRIAPSHE